jgi:hypothetical protein
MMLWQNIRWIITFKSSENDQRSVFKGLREINWNAVSAVAGNYRTFKSAGER